MTRNNTMSEIRVLAATNYGCVSCCHRLKCLQR